MKYNLITAEKIDYYLRTHTFGQKKYTLWSVRSTNEFAYNLASQGEPEGTLVIAEEQSAGKGRMNRKWDSQFGKGLWFSLILRPQIEAAKAGLYSYLASVAVAQAVENKIGIKPTLKWPNDLLLAEKKFCGILSEVEFFNNRVNFIIMGIGINVNHKTEDFPELLQQQATSLRIQARRTIERIPLLAEIIYLFEDHYYFAHEHGFDKIILNWKKRCPRLGKKINIIQNDKIYTGNFEDIDENGCLLLKTENGNLTRIVAGDFI